MRSRLPGFTLLELLVTIAIIGVLGSIGAYAYTQRIYEQKLQVMNLQFTEVNRIVELERNRLLYNTSSSLIDPTTNKKMTADTTCESFVTALRHKFDKVRNPLDKSPAVTFNSGSMGLNKAGKIQINCRKMLYHHTVNGAACPLEKSAISITQYIVPCGRTCGVNTCKFPKQSCQGLISPQDWPKMDVQKIIGTQDRTPQTLQWVGPPRYFRMVLNESKTRAECGITGNLGSNIGFEADY